MKTLILKIILLSSIAFACKADLHALETTIQQDLERINFSSYTWIPPEGDILDVAIIGGGMAGLTTAFAMEMRGVTNICIYDENPEYQEGPWHFARMRTLRTDKRFMGPALFLPNLTFNVWYESLHGKEAWESVRIKFPPIYGWITWHGIKKCSNFL